MTHEDRPYELHDDFLATLTRERYLKFRYMDTLSFSASSPSHHELSKLKTSFSGESKHQTLSESQTALNNFKKGTKRDTSVYPIFKNDKFNNPTPYPSGSKTKPNPTLGKSTPAPQQVHQHSQDEPTEEPPPDTFTQTLVYKCLAESGIDPTDIQNVMPVSYTNRDISPHESSRQIQTPSKICICKGQSIQTPQL